MASEIEQRLKNLERHLAAENPVLLAAVKSFRKLDKVARKLGYFGKEESYAIYMSWWPIVAILGTYSSGKSTFLNTHLGYGLQRTGNQAVDDRFSVVCYSPEATVRVLPGVALDADPRFPFYRMSRAIEEIEKGEGSRIDTYLQLKTWHGDALRGKIFIDSPGFDADDQRSSTLRLTNHIIDLSDLVLIFFDARHPEPGTMHDTLEHLVGETMRRPDANKFLYILNQMDTTAREDNPEDVVASWQRALAGKGLTAGRFYRIYDPNAAVHIADENLRERFELKRDADLEEIYARIRQVEVDRAYRVAGSLESTAREIEDTIVPRLRDAVARWRRKALWMDVLFFGVAIGGGIGLTLWTGQWEGLRFHHPVWGKLLATGTTSVITAVVLVFLGVYSHFSLRRIAAGRVAAGLRKKPGDGIPADRVENLVGAFRKNTRGWRSLFSTDPAGWGMSAKRLVREAVEDSHRFVQQLNDRFTNPSGDGRSEPASIASTVSPPTPAGDPSQERPHEPNEGERAEPQSQVSGTYPGETGEESPLIEGPEENREQP